MYNKILLLIIPLILSSCNFYVNEPDNGKNDQYNVNRTTNTTSSSRRGSDNNDSNRRGTDNNGNTNSYVNPITEQDDTEIFTPTVRYDSCRVNGILTFNVYLGWNVGNLRTIIDLRGFPKKGGKIHFNIYTNNNPMSMYEFPKYDKTIGWFSEYEPYCGYNSYSLETKGICKYELNITRNETGCQRYYAGYWSSNNNSAMLGEFKIVLFQNF